MAAGITIAELVRRRVKRYPKGYPFTLKRFDLLGATARGGVEKAIARMVRSSELERVCRGVYMRPKQSKYTGKNVRPSPLAVMEVVTRARGETIQMHGAEAARRLGLSTQMQVTAIYYTSGSSRVIQIGQATVRLVLVPMRYLQHAGTKVGLVITALFYMGKKEAISPGVGSSILKQLTPAELKLLMASHIPKWMREIFE